MNVLTKEQYAELEAQRVYPATKYSKLKIVRKLKELGLWDAVKAALVEYDAYDEWQVAQELSSEDTQFMELLNRIELPEGADICELLNQCILEE